MRLLHNQESNTVTGTTLAQHLSRAHYTAIPKQQSKLVYEMLTLIRVMMVQPRDSFSMFDRCLRKRAQQADRYIELCLLTTLQRLSEHP